MPTLTATLTLDTSAATTQWQSAKAAAAALSPKIQAVQATLGSITLTGAPSGSNVAFTVDHAQTDAALADLMNAEVALHDALIATQNAVNALAPTVTTVV